MKSKGDSQLSSLNQRITIVSFTKTCNEIDEGWIMMMEGHLAFGNQKFEFEISIWQRRRETKNSCKSWEMLSHKLRLLQFPQPPLTMAASALCSFTCWIASKSHQIFRAVESHEVCKLAEQLQRICMWNMAHTHTHTPSRSEKKRNSYSLQPAPSVDAIPHRTSRNNWPTWSNVWSNAAQCTRAI